MMDGDGSTGGKVLSNNFDQGGNALAVQAIQISQLDVYLSCGFINVAVPERLQAVALSAIQIAGHPNAYGASVLLVSNLHFKKYSVIGYDKTRVDGKSIEQGLRGDCARSIDCEARQPIEGAIMRRRE